MVTELFGDAAQQTPDPLLQRLRLATDGSYDVVGELGRGGMAVVYAGVDRKLQRRVAIKVMDPRLSMTPGMAARFLQEARIAARLQHPNIIVVHDVRQSDEIIFFVMSLIDGVAVDALCRHPQPMPIDQIRWMLFQAARALAYAHSEEIVHRDIKPANILLNLKGEVILTDFGIAKALGDTGLTQSGTQVGTPMYMSPEQFSGVPVGPASDQYALGVTAYQMITGRPPFSGDLYQLIAAHGGKTPTPLRELRPDCPAFLANAVMRMLEKQPADRWPSLEDVQDVFGANMAMDGGVARRALADTVRELRDAAGGNITVGGVSSGANSGPTSDASRKAPSNAERASGEREANAHARESVVVTISPPGATIFVSGALELRASIARDTGQSLPGAAAQWTSSDESVLRVQANGTVSGVSPGTAVVRASVSGGWSEATIRVEAAPIARLSLTTPSVTLRVGDVLRPDVIAIDVNGAPCVGVSMSWISRTPSVADLDAPGVVRAIAPGMAVIDVATGNVRRSIDVAVVRRPIARLQLTAATRTMQLGDASALLIDAFDDLGVRTAAVPARWASSAPSIIHIDSTGRALAIGPGVARLSASVDDATDSIEIEALEPPVGSLQLTLTDERIELGDELSWSLRVKDVHGAARSSNGVRVWSSAPDILQVDEEGLTARALRIGEALLHAAPQRDATAPDAATATSDATSTVRVIITDVLVARVELFPPTLDLEVGAVSAVNVQGVDRRGVPIMSATAQWESDAPAVAVVEGNGIVRAMAPGACTIRARMSNSGTDVVDATLSVRVRAAAIARLSVTADRTMVEAGETIRLQVATFDAMDVEVKDATPIWRSMQPTIAQIEPNGQLVALAPGRATITAELDGKSGQLTILVSPSAVASLNITVPNADVVVGVPVRLAIDARDRNGQAVSPAIQWRAEPAHAATITAHGEITASRVGAVTIHASLAVSSDATGLLSARSALETVATIHARAPRVTSLQFGAPSITMAMGRSLRADARATTDGSVTASAPELQWTSQHPDIVKVEANGELRALALGETRITATADDVRAVLHVRVTAVAEPMNRTKPLMFAGGGIVVAALAWMFWPSLSATAPATLAPAPSPTVQANAAEVAAPSVASPSPSASLAASDSVARADSIDTARLAISAAPRPVAPTASTLNTKPPKAPTASARAATGSAGASALPPRRVAPSVAPSVAPAPAPSATYGAPVAVPPSPPVSDVSGAAPSAASTAATEAPSATELRAIAERIAADVRSGKLRATVDLKQFFADGAEHKVSVGSSPAATPLDQGQVRTQFELALTRYNSGGALERRSTVVRIEVAKRSGVSELLFTSFGPLVKSSR